MSIGIIPRMSRGVAKYNEACTLFTPVSYRWYLLVSITNRTVLTVYPKHIHTLFLFCFVMYFLLFLFGVYLVRLLLFHLLLVSSTPFLSTPVSSTPVLSTPAIFYSCFVYSCYCLLLFCLLLLLFVSIFMLVTVSTFKVLGSYNPKVNIYLQH